MTSKCTLYRVLPGIEDVDVDKRLGANSSRILLVVCWTRHNDEDGAGTVFLGYIACSRTDRRAFGIRIGPNASNL